MYATWKLWVNTKSEDTAYTITNRVLKDAGIEALNITIEPYPKTEGLVLRFEVALTSGSWNDCVVEVIALGQRMAREWQLSGDVNVDISGWSTKAAVIGVRAAEWNLVHKNG